MAQPSPGSARNTSQHHSAVVSSSGEILGDGSIIELLSSASDRQFQLLFWHEHHKRVAPQVEHEGRIYVPIDVDPTLRRAIVFPTGAEDYGSAQKLFTQAGELFERYIGLAPPEAALLTAWNCCTWFPEYASSPPTLVISGPDMGHAIKLFRLLWCLCRRCLILSDISRNGLLAAMSLRPTLLVNQPGQFRRLWQLLGTSNFHGVYVLGNQGRVNNLAGCRAFFVGMEHTFNDGALHLALPPAPPELPTLDEVLQAEIAKRFQPKWLMYRLRNLSKVQQSHPGVLQFRFPESEIAQTLAACIQEDPEIAQAIAPILKRQEQDAQVQNSCDVVRAIIEVTWAPLHEQKEITISRITELTNALLRSRGETLEYRAAEVGWKLRNLGLYRHRNEHGKVLRPCRETSLIIHQLARRLYLNLSPVQACADCVHPEVVVAE